MGRYRLGQIKIFMYTECMDIRIIAAVDKNSALGAHGQMAWYVPQELRLFKQLTMGGILIMGRTTYESIGAHLPGRISIVLSHNLDSGPDHVNDLYYVSSINDAISLARKIAPDRTIWIAGGAQIYEQCINMVSLIHLSHMPFEIDDADVFFPNMDNKWRCVAQHPVWGNGQLLFTHKTYHRFL